MSLSFGPPLVRPSIMQASEQLRIRLPIRIMRSLASNMVFSDVGNCEFSDGCAFSELFGGRRPDFLAKEYSVHCVLVGAIG